MAGEVNVMDLPQEVLMSKVNYVIEAVLQK